MKSRFFPKSIPWNSLQLLGPIRPEDLCCSSEQLLQYEPYIWNDLASENDAERFYRYLENLGLNFSDSFQAVVQLWRMDEFDHYLGFKRLYHLLYSADEISIEQRLDARSDDFGELGEIVRDEFELCLVLAYDEIATARGYRKDFAFYSDFGIESLRRWIKFVAKDEALHYYNFIRVLRTVHRQRLPEAGRVINRILNYDLKAKEYKATFVLDHKTDQFSEPFLKECAEAVLRSLK